jgi:hypothetical protein
MPDNIITASDNACDVSFADAHLESHGFPVLQVNVGTVIICPLDEVL